MAEEDNFNLRSLNLENENDPIVSVNDFCLLSEDDIETEVNVENTAADNSITSPSYLSPPVGVEAIKRKAEEIASSLQKFRRNVNKDTEVVLSTNTELPEDLKRHHERSLFVAQKLKEDRILLEESKKRNEVVLDNVRTVKCIHKNISDNIRYLKREDDNTAAVKTKIEKLEASLSKLQELLADKNRIISEKNETIRSLNDSVTSAYDAHMRSLEQSEEQINQLKDEYTKTIEKITNSKDEFCNQLQVIRKKYLSVENDLKLSDFARSRLVSRNAELRERIKELEHDNSTLASVINDKKTSGEILAENAFEESQDKPIIAIQDLQPKVECLVFITNEFHSLLVDDGVEIEDINQENNDVLRTIDLVGDKLESAFYGIRDKLSSLSKLRNDVKIVKEKLEHFEKLNNEGMQREASLKELLSSTESKLHLETDINEELSEQLRSVRSSNDEWCVKYHDLDKLNEQLKYHLNILQSNEMHSDETNYQLNELHNVCEQLKAELETKSKENEDLLRSQDDFNIQLEILRSECVRLKNELETKSKKYESTTSEYSADVETEEYQKLCFEHDLLRHNYEDLNQECCRLADEVNTKSRKYENLRSEYENLRRACEHSEESNDKFENDFVVLQKRDCDEEENLKRNYAKLRDENEKLLENVRSMNQKAIEYENQKLFLNQYVDECKRLQKTVDRLSNDLQATSQQIHGANEVEQDISEDAKNDEIEGLQNEMAKLVQQLSQVWDQLHDEKSNNHDLEERLRYSENDNAELYKEVHKLREECQEFSFLKHNNDQLKYALDEIRQRIDELEVEKYQLFSELEKYKNLHNANIEQNEETKDWQCKYNELLATRSNSEEIESWKQHSAKLEEELQGKESELEQIRQQLQENSISIDEIESLKQLCSELRNEKTNAEQAYQHLYEVLNEQKQLLEQTQFELQSAYLDLKLSRETITKREESLRDVQSEMESMKSSLMQGIEDAREKEYLLERTRSELKTTKNELQQTHDQLQDMQKSINTLVINCSKEVENLENGIMQTKNENSLLRDQYESLYKKYNSFHYRVNEIFKRAKSISDDAVCIIQKLQQTHWKSLEEKVHVAVQYDENLALAYARDIYENYQQIEGEKYKTELHSLQQEFTSLQEQYSYAKQQLTQKDQECGVEITKYENLLTKLRTEENELQDRLIFNEQLLQQKDEDFQQYKSSMEKYIDSERANYQQCIEELQLQKSVAMTANASTQVSDSDMNPIDLIQSNENAISDAPTLTKYFDYYKGKVTKELCNILPLKEEQPVVDYSNWIFPEDQENENHLGTIKRMLESDETHDINTRQESYARDSQIEIDTQNQSSQTDVIAAFPHQTTKASHHENNVMKVDHDPVRIQSALTKPSISDVLDELKSHILIKFSTSDWQLDGNFDWNSNQLNLNDAEFTDTAFKFVDLFDTVIQYYFSLPATEEVLKKFKYVFDAAQLPESITKINCDYREIFEQVVTLATRLEWENKYLVDTMRYIEDLIISDPSIEVIHFHTVIEGWRGTQDVEETDVIDHICEEFDIIPTKFVLGDLFTQWREQLAKLLKSKKIVEPVKVKEYHKNLEVLKKKVQKLICDLHYFYSTEKTFNPTDFFEEIEDINYWVGHSIKEITSKTELESGKIGPELEEPGMNEEKLVIFQEEDHKHNAEHDDHDNHRDLDDHQQQHHRHHHQDHDHQHNTQDPQKYDNSPKEQDAVKELKTLLAERSKKIDKLVNELMEIKKSREYNEVRQLHLKLDETLYQLHLKDVHVVELTQELTQLLSERDSLQLKLSNIIRQNEQLREASFFSSMKESDVRPTDLENKLEQLNTVNYMKDPRISEASKQYYAAELHLFNDDHTESARNKAESAGFSVPSLLKWITGDTENK